MSVRHLFGKSESAMEIRQFLLRHLNFPFGVIAVGFRVEEEADGYVDYLIKSG